MKKIKYILYLAFSLSVLSSCESFKDASDAEIVEYIKISVETKSVLAGIDNPEGLEIVFNNYATGVSRRTLLDGEKTAVDSLIPGIYSISIEGEAFDAKGDKFLMKGALVNYPLFKNGESVEVSINGLRASALVFKEIFYAGTASFYFRNQFYEIYNMSEKTVYLDGLHFANLTPGTATTKLPTWPEEDGEDYAYAERVWKFPGSGTEYPLAPGESCVISQFAANHKLDKYNPNSPIDGSSSDFEFNMNNANFPDQPAYDMLHVFYNGQAAMGTVPQYLTSVFGGAYVIFRPLEGDVYDPVDNPNLKTKDLASTGTTQYAKIPISYILDAVEAGNNASMIAAKRVPSVLDAGMTWVGANYNSLGVARKVKETRADGVLVLEDNNNSTTDFEIVTPQLRRYGAKMPSWNHTLQGK